MSDQNGTPHLPTPEPSVPPPFDWKPYAIRRIELINYTGTPIVLGE